MLCCSDNSLYTGYTTDISHRLKVHNQGKGSAYTRSHRPVRLVYLEEMPTKSDALKREYKLKQLSHKEKEALSVIWFNQHQKEEYCGTK